ncbi:hypothetical protein AVEN_272688-1 [Araneus ventricosus]|uniref:Uncharacterized protein n=1 Tax=Araneus ventricosus TaxID=182803 RepID=A0A4Y2PZF7_ARAVE|nr:hypothetical protein AVEN_272688-1 [Araneus ventricosus]
MIRGSLTEPRRKPNHDDGWHACLKSSSKRHATSPPEQVKKNYHIQRYEFSQQQYLLFTGTSSCSTPAITLRDPDGPSPTHPLPPTTAADYPIPRIEIIHHHQCTISGD